MSPFPFSSLKRLPGARAVAVAGTAFLSGLLAFAPASAQAPDYASVEATPAYWHLSDADSDVYIFGTFHILPADLDWLTGDLANVADTADALYLEADVHSAEGQAAIQGLLPRYGFNPPGVTLSSMLDAETQALLAEFAPTVGASPAMLDPMRPWLAQVVLAVGQMQALGLDASAGAEMALLARMQPRDVTLGYFETPEEQIAFLAQQPDEVQVEMFAEGLQDLESMPEEIHGMLMAWAAGDMDALDGYINGDMREQAPELHEILITRRNRNWVPQIVEIMDGEGTVLIAVGAGHLPGDDGVIALLEEAGLEPVRQ
jgi:uncharacterized protein YbaP (TraB family)